MSVVVTVRNVAEEVHDILAAEARLRGLSLQAFLLQTLEQQAAFSRNRSILTDIEADLAEGGAVGADAPGPDEVIADARDERELG